MSPLLDSAMLAVGSPVALAVATVTGLLAARARQAPRQVLAFGCACVMVGWWLIPAMLAAAVPPAGLVLLGSLLAWDPPWSSKSMFATALFGGVAAGLAGGAQTSTAAESVAAAFALCSVAAIALSLRLGLRRAVRLVAWLPRVAGAWAAALGALLLALQLRQALA